MLGTVKDIASTVFKFAADKQEEPEDDEAYDIDSSSEMKLLERVVAKLATIAHLQAENTANVDTKDMDESDIGILSMMKGTNLVEEKKKQDRRSMAVTRRNAFTPTVNLEDIGMSQEVYNSWSFNILSLSKPQKINAAMFTIHRFHESGDGYVNSDTEIATLKRFVNKVETEYLDKNPFHNFSHAVDVLLAVARWMRVNDSHTFLVELEQFALLIAAISHDLAHPGVNNAFLTEVAHDLALEYNDRSPLENMHCAKLYTMVINPTVNPFATLSKDQYKDVRKYCIETILHTDMMGHNGMVKELQLLYEVKSEIFATSEGKNNIAVAEVFNTGETKFLVMNNILHSADISNPCRTWDVCRPWAMQVLEEFFEQGDEEKRLGVPVQFLNDRDKLNRPNSQIGFLEFMIVPHFAAQIRLWPTMAEMGQNLQTNLQHWEEIWKKESSPSEEEATKTRNRVKKACGTLEEAEHCRKTEKKVAVH
jgi:cAMP-specific phosphodiesterase 4